MFCISHHIIYRSYTFANISIFHETFLTRRYDFVQNFSQVVRYCPDNIFWVVFNNYMGLQLFIFSLGLPDLGTNVIKPCRCVTDNRPAEQPAFKDLTRKWPKSSQKILKKISWKTIRTGRLVII